jgi:hypothetical protein
MRAKELRYLVTFHTVTDAMAMETFCKSHELPGRLIPVPSQISAGCGMAWSAPDDAADLLRSEMDREGLRREGEYELLLVP